MSKYIIKGGKKLEGSIRVSGNKNAVLPIMAATLLTAKTTILTNVPVIGDVIMMGKLLKSLGAKIEGLGTDRLVIDTSGVSNSVLDNQLVSSLRASVLLLGPLLARFGEAKMKHPGGCIIGRRAVGTHFDALAGLGAETITTEEFYESSAERLKAATILLDEASVTATENVMMAASLLSGRTVIDNAACEPHVVDLGNYLIKAGVEIEGVGTNRVIIKGKKQLKNVEHRLIPDYMEAGTFAMMAAVTGSQLTITHIVPEHLQMILLYLSRMGMKFRLGSDTLEMLPSQLVAPKRKVQTRPWPGFPTDLMSPLIVVATQAQGTTLCHDWMYETRMFFVDKLIRMGANITICDPHRVLVTGPTKLRGKELSSPDIRAGIALVIAALAAEEESIIHNIEIIERGYENIEKRIKSLGGQIEKRASP